MTARFDEALERRLSEGVVFADEPRLAAKAAGLDHPLFTQLSLGESLPGEAVVLFLDIRRYTRLSMALEPQKAARVVDAVLGASIEALVGYGAHINDFTGDGIMAVFGGETGSLGQGHPAALYSVADLMSQMTATLREDLLQTGIDDPVQVAIGVYSGPVLWARVGTPEHNRVGVLGEVAPLAAKFVTGEQTNAWETMVGGEIAEAIPDDYKTYQGDLVRQYRHAVLRRSRWLLDTESLHTELPDLGAAMSFVSEASAASFAAATGARSPTKRRGKGDRPERTTG